MYCFSNYNSIFSIAESLKTYLFITFVDWVNAKTSTEATLGCSLQNLLLNPGVDANFTFPESIFGLPSCVILLWKNLLLKCPKLRQVKYHGQYEHKIFSKSLAAMEHLQVLELTGDGFNDEKLCSVANLLPINLR